MKKVNTNGCITGISVCVPTNKYININYPHQTKDKLLKFIATTGIKERRIVNKTEMCTSDLGFVAVKKLIKKLNWKNNDVDFLIFISQTADYLTPATSAILQDRLMLKKNIFTLDVNYGCSGFPYGAALCFSLIDNLKFNKGILVIGDVLSKVCSIKDHSTWPLFGDACAAVAFEKKKKKELVFFDFYTDGSGYRDIIVNSHSLAGRNRLKETDFIFENKKTIKKNNVNLSLNGANVYSFAISKIPERIKNLISFSKIRNSKIKYCFLHQANKLINNTIKFKLNLKKTKFPTSLEKFGNTSAATIPVSIVNNFKKKQLNGLSICSGFGVGLSVANMIYNFKNCKVLSFSYL